MIQNPFACPKCHSKDLYVFASIHPTEGPGIYRKGSMSSVHSATCNSCRFSGPSDSFMTEREYKINQIIGK